MEWRKEGDKMVVRLKRGEKVMATLNEFLDRSGIKGGFLQGIGAVEDVDLASYSITTKDYVLKRYPQHLELSSMMGTITETGLHAHVVLSDHELKCYAGHLMEAKVYATVEIFITEMKKIRRIDDKETGLKLMEL